MVQGPHTWYKAHYPRVAGQQYFKPTTKAAGSQYLKPTRDFVLREKGVCRCGQVICLKMESGLDYVECQMAAGEKGLRIRVRAQMWGSRDRLKDTALPALKTEGPLNWRAQCLWTTKEADLCSPECLTRKYSCADTRITDYATPETWCHEPTIALSYKIFSNLLQQQRN